MWSKFEGAKDEAKRPVVGAGVNSEKQVRNNGGLGPFNSSADREK